MADRVIRPEGQRGIALGMSNFDHTIDEGFAEALMAEPGRVFGAHAGWEFYGYVWFSDGQFHEEIWRHGSPREIMSAPTCAELMEAVCEEWGSS